LIVCTDTGTCETGISPGADPLTDRITRFHDGEWHFIEALRMGDTISINVDNRFSGIRSQ